MLSFLLLPCWLAACECRCRHSMPNQGIAMFDQFNFHGGERKFHFNTLDIHPFRMSFQKRYYLSIYETTDLQTLKMITPARIQIYTFLIFVVQPGRWMALILWIEAEVEEERDEVILAFWAMECYAIVLWTTHEKCWSSLSIALHCKNAMVAAVLTSMTDQGKAIFDQINFHSEEANVYWYSESWCTSTNNCLVKTRNVISKLIICSPAKPCIASSKGKGMAALLNSIILS